MLHSNDLIDAGARALLVAAQAPCTHVMPGFGARECEECKMRRELRQLVARVADQNDRLWRRQTALLSAIIEVSGPRPRPEFKRLQSAANTLLAAQAAGLELALMMDADVP